MRQCQARLNYSPTGPRLRHHDGLKRVRQAVRAHDVSCILTQRCFLTTYADRTTVQARRLGRQRQTPSQHVTALWGVNEIQGTLSLVEGPPI